MDNIATMDILSKSTSIVCEKCGNQTFRESLLLRRVSRLITGEAKDGILPIPVFACTKCGHINKEFIPSILHNESDENNQLI